jgi:gliding motility-associated-like protein
MMLSGVGTTQLITLTATDDAGNTDICTFTIRVTDTSLPVISGCPADITVSTSVSSCDAHVNWVAPTASDNCSVVLTSSHNPGDPFPLGETTVTYKAEDASGNVATCSFRVVVEDKVAPVFSNCVSRVTATALPGSCEAMVTWTAPTASDICGSTTVISPPQASGDIFPVGTTRVTYTATDARGNSATCAFDVVVVSEEIPVITGCPEDLDIRITEAGAVPVSWTAPVATVSCGVVTMTSSHDPGDLFDLGSTEVVYTATDDAGHRTECRFNVVVAYEEIVLDIGKVITPNGDGVNDEWSLVNIEKFRNNKVVVVDRWGGVVFSATGYNNDNVVWKGDNRHGSGVPTGTYFYTITVRSGPSQVEKTGFIELIR